MLAMILAAGFGHRLGGLTQKKPKALVEIHNVTLLEIAIRRLMQFGFAELIINVHHFAEQIIEFLEQKKNFGALIHISHEETLLGTGGALKKAAEFFPKDEPFLLHNVDILCDMDYRKLLEMHTKRSADITLAVRKRNSERGFLFDKNDELGGWHLSSKKQEQMIKVVRLQNAPLRKLGFLGISVLSPKLFGYFPEQAEFGLVEPLLAAACDGVRIFGYEDSTSKWIDAGTPERLKTAEEMFR